MNEPLSLRSLVGGNERGKRAKVQGKGKKTHSSGVLGLLRCASFPVGITVVFC